MTTLEQAKHLLLSTGEASVDAAELGAFVIVGELAQLAQACGGILRISSAGTLNQAEKEVLRNRLSGRVTFQDFLNGAWYH